MYEYLFQASKGFDPFFRRDAISPKIRDKLCVSTLKHPDLYSFLYFCGKTVLS